MEQLRLNERGRELAEEFKAIYGDSSCSCHTMPPCGYCTHPGNPLCLEETDEVWEQVPHEVFGLKEELRSVFPPGRAELRDFAPKITSELTRIAAREEETGEPHEWDAKAVAEVLMTPDPAKPRLKTVVAALCEQEAARADVDKPVKTN